MPILYYAPGTCALAVHIVLEWIGEPYEAKRVNQHDPSYRAINPAGAVPAFDDGGSRPLTQCAAILHYLAETHPAADLLDRRSAEHDAELHRWSAFLTGDLHPAFWPHYFPTRYTTSRDPEALEQVKAAAPILVRSKIALLEDHLNGRTWMVGDKRTFLDAYATPMLNWTEALLPGGLSAFPACQAHHARMLEDPAVQRAMSAEGLTHVRTE